MTPSIFAAAFWATGTALGAFPLLRGLAIAVLGVGTWALGLVVAYYLYRHYQD